MFFYTRWGVNILAFIISIIIFVTVGIVSTIFQEIANITTFKVSFKTTQNEIETVKEQEIIQKEKVETEESVEWYLEIPKINLKATIAEGTTEETMNQYIGHFEETPKQVGNIALAAHNRGYENNYFSGLKNLKKGDEIIYSYQGKEIKYIVEEHVIIEDTDWSYLEETEDNRITLITCVENEPNYRRCIQGIEIK